MNHVYLMPIEEILFIGYLILDLHIDWHIGHLDGTGHR